MSIWEICIRRPVFTVMLVSAPIVLGLASYTRLGVDLFPNVDLPIVSVTTTLRGTSVEEMETQVTKPIEEICNTVSVLNAGVIIEQAPVAELIRHPRHAYTQALFAATPRYDRPGDMMRPLPAELPG